MGYIDGKSNIFAERISLLQVFVMLESVTDLFRS